MSSWKENGSACKRKSSAPSRLARRDGKSSGVCGATSCSGCMRNSNLASNLTPCTTCSPLEAARPKSAKIEINQYGRGEISIYEWIAYLDGWWGANEYRDTFERDGGIKAVYLCALHV